MTLKKRHSLLLASLSFGLLLAASLHAVQGPKMTVYKTATCGCCGKWVEHVKNNGFQVTVHEVADLSEYKERYGVPKELESCHTAIVGGYTIEGHVPAADILRLLKEKPAAKGLAAPGMPLGSPGMEMGDRKDAYDVLLFTADGKTTVFQHHKGN
ncbi:MAG TPA: DUF411 domain-containing protein [Terriglobia bacterium]|nr:DUF411 domain-containing protein [Terriglobia bacterium]